jgi:hypothetical protein
LTLHPGYWENPHKDICRKTNNKIFDFIGQSFC